MPTTRSKLTHHVMKSQVMIHQFLIALSTDVSQNPLRCYQLLKGGGWWDFVFRRRPIVRAVW